jgi:hypothetical protein
MGETIMPRYGKNENHLNSEYTAIAAFCAIQRRNVAMLPIDGTRRWSGVAVKPAACRMDVLHPPRQSVESSRAPSGASGQAAAIKRQPVLFSDHACGWRKASRGFPELSSPS